MRERNPLIIPEPSINRGLILSEVRGVVSTVKDIANSYENVFDRKRETPPRDWIETVPEVNLPAYSVYTLEDGIIFKEDLPVTAGIVPTTDTSSIFITNEGYPVEAGQHTRDKVIDIYHPKLVNYDEAFGDPTVGNEVGVTSGAIVVRKGLKGLLVVDEPDTVNHRVWVIRHFNTQEADNLYLVEPKEDAIYPKNEGFVDGVPGYIHQWDSTTCSYVKDTGTEIKIFDPTGWNLVLPDEPVFARKITQYCVVSGELVAKERYEIIGSHGLYRKTVVPKISSGSQRLKVASCGEEETVNILNTVSGAPTFTLDINISHGPHNPLFELDEPIAYYDRQQQKFYINPYDPPETAIAIASANNCGSEPISDSGLLYMDRFDINCETTDLRSNTWPHKNPYQLAFHSGDQLEYRRSLIDEEYVLIQTKIRSKNILNNLQVTDCTISFTTDKIYGYDCGELTGSSGISMTQVEALTSVGTSSCGLVFGTTTFCVLNPAAGGGVILTGNTITFVAGVSVDQDPTSKDCNIVFDLKQACVLGSVINIADTTIDFVQKTVVTDISKVVVTGGTPSDCVVVSTNTISVLCVKNAADTETNLFCFTDCTPTVAAAMGVKDAPIEANNNNNIEMTDVEKAHSKNKGLIVKPEPRPDTTQILLKFLKELSEKTGVVLPKEIQEMIK